MKTNFLLPLSPSGGASSNEVVAEIKSPRLSGRPKVRSMTCKRENYLELVWMRRLPSVTPY